MQTQKLHVLHVKNSQIHFFKDANQKIVCFACHDWYNNNNNNNKIKNLVSIIAYQNNFSREKIRSENYVLRVNIFLKNIFVPEEEADDCIYQHYKGQLVKKGNNITSYQPKLVVVVVKKRTKINKIG